MYGKIEDGIIKQIINGEEISVVDVNKFKVYTKVKNNSLFICSLDNTSEEIAAMTIVTDSEENRQMLKDKTIALLFALHTGLPPIVRVGAMLLDFSNAPDVIADKFIRTVNDYVSEKPKRHNMIIGRHLKNVGHDEDIELSNKKYTWYMGRKDSERVEPGSIVVVKTSKGHSEVLVERTYRLDDGGKYLELGEFKRVVYSKTSKSRTKRLKARIVTNKK